MQSFTDSSGRDYSISLTLGAVKAVAAAAKVDLLDVYDSNPLVGSRSKPIDVIAVIDVVYLLCRKDCERHGVDDVQFSEAMGAAHMQAAVDAFYAEWTDFFRALNRPDSAKVIQKTRELLKVASMAAEARMDQIDLQGIVDKIIGKIPGAGAADLPEPQASATAT